MDIDLVNQTVAMMNPQEQVVAEQIAQPLIREATKPTKKSEVIGILKQQGLNNSAIAGIMGNIDVETGGTFDFQQQEKEGTGYGLFQLTPSGPLPKAYNKFLEENGLTDDAGSQIDFMIDTIYGKNQNVIGAGNAKKLRESFESGDASKVAEDFMKIWERPGVPHKKRRLESAKKFDKELNPPSSAR